MFYSELLLSKKGPLGIIWIAAHCHKRLKKEQVQQTNIASSVDKILLDEAPVVTYRILGFLLLGLVRIQSKKVDYLLQDSNRILEIVFNFVTCKKSASKLSALKIEGMRAPRQSITRPKSFELDTFELEIVEDCHANSGHVAAPQEITLADARNNERTCFGSFSTCREDVSFLVPSTGDHTPIRDVLSDHLIDKNSNFKVGSGYLSDLWHLNETRFSLEERFEPMSFGDIDIQMTSAKTIDHQTDDVPMEGSVDKQTEIISPPIDLSKCPDIRVSIDDKGSADHGESILAEKNFVAEQKKEAYASSTRSRKDHTKDDHPVSLSVDVSPESKIPGSTSPDFVSVSTPATKERTRISRKRKCLVEESIVISNQTYRSWLNYPDDLVCKRKKAPHNSYRAWLEQETYRQSFEEPLIACACDLSVDRIAAICKSKSRVEPAKAVGVPPRGDIPESSNTPKSGEQTPLAASPGTLRCGEAMPIQTVEVPPRGDVPVSSNTLKSGEQSSIAESPGTLRCGEETPVAPTAASMDVGIPESPNIVPPIAPATPVTGSSSLRFHDMRVTSPLEPESSIESREKGALPMEHQELEMNLMDEDINSFEGDTSEKSNFSLRTRKIARLLVEQFPALKGKEGKVDIDLSWLLKGKTKGESARFFYETLVLKTGSWIDVQQDKAYSDIHLQVDSRLKQIFEADGVSPSKF